ncbi:MAG: leucine-rich repeat domain-containing protein [Eubacteriales bacterium]|nr:leucine-rich repeat domain-containing protein [Eubacteriales bacterium]
MKRLIACLMTLTLLFSCVPGFAAWRENLDDYLGKVTYKIDEEKYMGDMELDDVELFWFHKEIGARAFANSSLSSIRLPEALSIIGDGAFYGCKNLHEILIFPGVRRIGANAFTGCAPDFVLHCFAGSYAESYAKSNGIAYKAYEFGADLRLDNEFEIFASLNCYPEVLEIPEQICSIPVTSVKGDAFEMQPSLRRVHFPGSIKKLSQGAFKGCMSLEECTIGEGVREIEEFSFTYCHSLKKIDLPSTLKRLGWYSFRGCTALESIVIPEGVEKIERLTFSSCSALRSVSLPSSIVEIDDAAFSECIGLKEFVVPENVRTLGRSAFWGCSSLERIVLPENIRLLDDDVFAKCSALRYVRLPERLMIIDDRAFEECASLESIVLPGGVFKIGRQAFHDCSSLRSVTIPESVYSISDNAFEGCPKDLVIYGAEGSYAQRYAQEQGIAFKAVELSA